jgi:K(+)-stimulated pyrophosphate-energized sodium pump
MCTTAAQRELLGVGVLAVLSPIIVGFLLHEVALGGFLAGVILSGQLLAVFMANAGGAWDNAKKTIEDGLYGGKGSEAHKASVVGDTVGDPLKDTSGPALNPMIKVINLVSLLIVPLIVQQKGQISLAIGVGIAIAVAIVGVALWYSKKASFGEAAEVVPAAAGVPANPGKK